MESRFQDTVSAYRTHRRVTNEAEAISAAIAGYTAEEFDLVRGRLRLLDAGVGDGRVLRGVLERISKTHKSRPCEVVLKEYDFQHIEALLQKISPMLRSWPRLSLFVTNRTFRHLQGFPADVCRENTVCFDDVGGYRMLAMVGTSSLLSQEDSLRHSFPRFEERSAKERALLPGFMPNSDLWHFERALLAHDPATAPALSLKALGDEIRAREIYDELAAAGGDGKRFTVTVARQEDEPFSFAPPREFFWDLAIVSHAFNRDRDPGWICRNILGSLCQGLSVGGVLVNVHAAEGGQVSELKEEIFRDRFPFRAPPHALANQLEAAIDSEQFQLLRSQKLSYRAHMTKEELASLEPWEREIVLHQMAVSVAYHLQIPDEAWVPRSDAIQAKIEELLEREGVISYSLGIIGVKRRE